MKIVFKKVRTIIYIYVAQIYMKRLKNNTESKTRPRHKYS